MPDSKYPKNFTWGVATSAYQIEGAADDDGRGLSIWDTFCGVPGNIADNSCGTIACDHYHRLEDDLNIMAQIGVNAYRFSISWPRIQPTGKGKLNAKGLDFYERLLDGLLKRNITPHLTLYHWDLPQALQDEGGWASRDIIQCFADYAQVVIQHLGDRVQYVVTHNEPWVVAVLGHQSGIFAPGIKDRKIASQVSHHLLISHGLAIQAMRALHKKIEYGIALNLSPFQTLKKDAAGIASAKLEDGLLTRWYTDALLLGQYPTDILTHLDKDIPDIKSGDFSLITTPMDFLGVNYYSRNVVDATKEELLKMGSLGYTEMDWEVYPDGLVELCTRLKQDYPNLPPIYITENGAAYQDEIDNGHVHDEKRTQYLQLHTGAVADAIDQGVDIRGYFVWSLFDNFEWAFGYTKRFGIVYIDYQTQKRILKDSALWYTQFMSSMKTTY